MRVVLLLLLGGVVHAAQTFSPQQGIGSGPAATALAAGYLLLTALLAGDVFKRFGLPRLTGYLAAGVVVGPHVLGLLSEPVVDRLLVFNGLAVALIALTAGAEMHLRSMRPLLRTISWISAVAVLGTTLLLVFTVLLLRGWLPFLAGLGTGQVLAVSLVLAVTMVAQSPAIVVALRDETAADGPVSQTVLGVVVLADLLVILMFAVVSSLAKSIFGAGADVVETVLGLSWEILGSLGSGAVIGFLISIYLRKITGSGALFVVTVAFVVAEVGQRVHFDPLLVALAAGMFIRNFTEVGDRLHHEIEAASLPVYVAFFGVAGATLHVHALLVVGVPATIFVLVRAAGFLAGTRVAAQLAGAPAVVGRYAGFGLLPQAGLALALALLFARTFPEFGAGASALVFAVVALNEIVAPIAYRVALVRSGEAGRRQGAIPLSGPPGSLPPAPAPEPEARAG